MQIKCFSCGASLKKSPSHIREKNFCNHTCYSVYKAEKWKSDNNPRWSGGNIEVKCIVCGKKRLEKRHGNKKDFGKYCSIKCSAKDRGSYQRGNKHPMWKGGRDIRTATPIRRTAKYKEWVNKVFERDCHTCQNCFTRGGTLHAHHINRIADLVEDYIEKNKTLNVDDDVFYDINNGQTLCKKCHRKTFKV
jgi:hypothetical protein